MVLHMKQTNISPKKNATFSFISVIFSYAIPDPERDFLKIPFGIWNGIGIYSVAKLFRQTDISNNFFSKHVLKL